MLVEIHESYKTRYKMMPNPKKMMFIVILIATVNTTAFAGTIYRNRTRHSAIKVFFVNDPSQADLFVYFTNDRAKTCGHDGIWYYVNKRSNAEAVINIVTHESWADVKAYRVSDREQAGWRKSNRYKGKFHRCYQ